MEHRRQRVLVANISAHKLISRISKMSGNIRLLDAWVVEVVEIVYDGYCRRATFQQPADRVTADEPCSSCDQKTSIVYVHLPYLIASIDVASSATLCIN